MTIIPRTKSREREVKIKTPLEKIIEETHEKAKELQEVTSEVEIAQKTVMLSRREHDRIIREKAVEERELNHKKDQGSKVQNDSKFTESRRQVLAADFRNKQLELDALVAAISEQNNTFVSGKKSIEETKLALEEVQLKLSGLNKEIESIKRTIVDLKSEEGEWSRKIELLKKEEDKILGNIETAISNFRRFEYRMKKLSEETGYRVNYSEVEIPVKN